MRIGRVYEVFQTDFSYTEHYLARELARDGHQTVFITSNKYLSSWERYLRTKEGIGSYKYSDFEVYRLNAFFPFEKAIFKNPFKLSKILSSSDFDMLHLYGIGSFSTIMVLWLLNLTGRKACRVLISDHSDTRTHTREGMLADAYYKFFALQLKFLKRSIYRVVTFSTVGIDVHSKRFGLDKDYFQVIPLGYDQDNYYYRPELKNNDVKMILGYAGKITPKKRVDFLIRVLDSMELAPYVKLIVVGFVNEDPHCRQLMAIAKESSVEVEFRPFASNEELSEFYNYVDLAIYPGGISITTIEASGCGTPVVIYESIPDLVERVQNSRGHLFKNEEDLRSLIAHYYNLYEQNKIDNRHIEQVTKATSSWAHIKEQYLQLYKQVRNERKG